MLFFFKQKTAYEMRISDWSSDVCSSDLESPGAKGGSPPRTRALHSATHPAGRARPRPAAGEAAFARRAGRTAPFQETRRERRNPPSQAPRAASRPRPEEHTSEHQSLMRTSYAVFCVNNKNQSSMLA